MAQEFTIKSEDIESKINQLLPSQGGFGAGVDFSASTMVVPIVDLTETAEGSALRQDLQRAYSFKTTNDFSVNNTTTTVLNTTGYFNFFGYVNGSSVSAGNVTVNFILNDGATDKTLASITFEDMSTTTSMTQSFDFDVFLEAGHSVKIQSGNSNITAKGSFRQLADINGNLTNP